MSDQKLKGVQKVVNDQWTVRDLLSKILQNKIRKPKFQRKRKWNNKPSKKGKDTVPNEKAFITFLYHTLNSVHAITFGQIHTSDGMVYSNIDGNNRINAMANFMNKPFLIFEEKLEKLNAYIDNLSTLTSDEKQTYKQLIADCTYTEIMKFKYKEFFKNKGEPDLYNNKLVRERDIGEDIIEQIKQSLQIMDPNTGELEPFDGIVKINVNLFENYSIDNLSKTFEDINKYNSKLTDNELLASRLYHVLEFIIDNKIIYASIIEELKDYYSKKSMNEALECYEFTEEKINAFDFITGFQRYCHTYTKFTEYSINDKEVSIIEKPDEDLSLFFKLFRIIYDGFENENTKLTNFTTENVNEFIQLITYSCTILKQTINNIFSDKINLFGNSCQERVSSLKKNNMVVLISSIIGYKKKNHDEKEIIKNIEVCLLYHFFVNDLRPTDSKNWFKEHDKLTYRAGGGVIEKTSKTLLSNPDNIISSNIKSLFEKILLQLNTESNIPSNRKTKSGGINKSTRRSPKFYQKLIMYYYFKNKIPIQMLNNKFSIEHIFPNSSEWDGQLDKDRTGNLIPITVNMNSSRGNRHITTYKDDPFFEYVKDIIPQISIYNTIIKHEGTKPKIISVVEYNKICEENETKYTENFIITLF